MRLGYKFIIAVLFLFSTLCNADEIYFYNGKIFKNCQVKDTVDSKVIVVTVTKEFYLFEKTDFIRKEQKVPLSDIYKTIITSFDSQSETQIIYGDKISQPLKIAKQDSFQNNYNPKNDNKIDLLVGLGVNGVNDNKNMPLSYAFSFGLIKNGRGILSTFSYGEIDRASIVRVAGFATKFLFCIYDKTYVGIGPEIHITILGLMNLHFGAALYYNLIDDDLILTAGYSGFDKINCGILFYM